MGTLTFDQLPQAVVQLYNKLENIEKLLLQKSDTAQPEKDELLTVKEAASFLSLSVPTIYGLISQKALPVMKPGKRCYFSKKDLTDYLKASRRKTTQELAGEAEAYVNRKAR